MRLILSPLLALALLAGCGGNGQPEAQAPAPAEAPAPAAPAEAPPSPDGPADLAVPDVSTVSTDPAVIAKGEAAFNARGCGACHAFGSKLVGPDLTGVAERRTPTWIARMIRHPEQMTKRDPVAKDLFKTHMTQMTNQQVTDEELPAMIAFLASKKGQ